MQFAIQLRNEHIASVRLQPAKPIAFVSVDGRLDVSEAHINESQLKAIADRLKTLPHKIKSSLADGTWPDNFDDRNSAKW